MFSASAAWDKAQGGALQVVLHMFCFLDHLGLLFSFFLSLVICSFLLIPLNLFS